MQERHFTLDEANEALVAVRPLAERMVAHTRALRKLERNRAALASAIGGNGGDIVPSELADVTQALERARAGLGRCLAEIAELGAIVKDLDTGLVDFPALRDGVEVLLCWRVGEAEIEYWHGVEEGFAGRKPVDG